MELTHDFIVPAPIDRAWASFMDLERVGGCFPGATVTSVSEEAFEGTVKVKLGPIALVYTGSGAFLSRDDQAHRAVIEAKGKDKRGNGTAGATVTVHLSPSGSGTRVDVTTDLAITGKPAQFGRGVMQDVSDKLLQQFVICIESQFHDAESAAAEASSGGASAAGEPGEPGTPAEPGLPGEPGEPPRTDAGSGAPIRQVPAGPERESRPLHPAPGPGADDSINLGTTVVPVILRAYAPHLAAAAAGLFLGWWLRGALRS